MRITPTPAPSVEGMHCADGEHAYHSTCLWTTDEDESRLCANLLYCRRCGHTIEIKVETEE